jgi:hypothetical protein
MISSSRRRGMTSTGICELTALKQDELRELEERFMIRPSVELGSELQGDMIRPLVLSWPEASVVLVKGKEELKDAPFEGRVLVTTRMSDAFIQDADGILFANPEEGVLDSLERAYPRIIFSRSTGND